jgi:hypothetical protein
MLRARGINMFFDTMRYENAFFGRRADVDRIKALLERGLDATLETFEALIVKYGEASKRNLWTFPRLLSDMSIDEVAVADVIPLDCIVQSAKPVSRLSFCNEVQITGMAPEIIEQMFVNRAVLVNEGDAHAIERWPNVPEPISVTLRTFGAKEGWTFP